MKLILAAGLLSAVTVATPGLASADQQVAIAAASAPVSVVTSESLAFVQPPLDYRTQAFKTERVRFVNRGTVVATDVSFQVVRDGQTRIVDDRGSFAPGVAITRSIQEYEGASYLGAPERWTVMTVRFADGTSWTAKPTPNVATIK